MHPLALSLAALAAVDFPHTLSLRITGQPDELFALHTRFAGDVDADGYGDLLVYSLRNPIQSEGVVDVVSGRDGSLIRSFGGLGLDPWSGVAGVRMDGAGDVDGDGHDDVILGDPARERVVIHSGSDGSILRMFTGASTHEGFGGAVANVGDVNGDGIDDVMAGTTAGDVGYAIVFSGADGSQLRTLRGKAHGDLFGAAVSAIGDVDGDGFTDFGVGAIGEGKEYLDPGAPPFVPPHRADNDSGGVSVFSGRDGSELYTILGSAGHDGFGYSIDRAGDVNGDGFDDFVVGSLSIISGCRPGYARLVSGVDGATLFTWLGGAQAKFRFVTVAGAGDVDGDSVPDVLVGAESVTADAHLYSGATGAELFRAEGDFPASTIGVSVAGGRDVDGDGIPDFLIGVAVAAYGAGDVRLYVSGQ